MSGAVINHNLDLKRLQDEGYEVEIAEGHAIVHHIPYLDSKGSVKYGVIVSTLNMAGDKVAYKNAGNNHVAYFQGEKPYRANGTPLNSVVNQPYNATMAGIPVNWMLSNKPQGGYKDYYHKLSRYILILSAEAQAVDSSVTAKTFKRVVTSENSIFCYEDTNASRGAITDVTSRLKSQKVAIVGLGGTGSYILDLVAKTPVAEIHLYDGDVFCQHNAFRAPGAPSANVFEKQLYKTDYLVQIYGNMRNSIYSHPAVITGENLAELQNLDFVFLAIDSGECKRNIVNFLCEHNICFIDTGIDVQRKNEALFGMVRDTVSRNSDPQEVNQYISYAETDKDLYSSNIQTADLNALCATLAVIEWKKASGFYTDNVRKSNCVYSTNNGEIIWA